MRSKNPVDHARLDPPKSYVVFGSKSELNVDLKSIVKSKLENTVFPRKSEFPVTSKFLFVDGPITVFFNSCIFAVPFGFTIKFVLLSVPI